ncbi:hypothetical protein FH972_022900 [Carpinus fangiana]|uniref:histidine kinase n=1 Tax=Carpinus fangiana TaxID=176857 RepID=A0A5N6KVU8_9ROSI|nr:hypothetical protein FH972_022900 [Carpinus fangiana]
MKRWAGDSARRSGVQQGNEPVSNLSPHILCGSCVETILLDSPLACASPRSHNLCQGIGLSRSAPASTHRVRAESREGKGVSSLPSSFMSTSGPAMDRTDHPHADDPSAFLAWLLGRLRDELGPSYTWDDTFTTAHSSYEDWHVWGTLHLDSSNAGLAGSSTPSRASASSKPPSPQPNPNPFFSPASSEARHGSRTPSESSRPGQQWVLARISKHVLRLDRQYQLARTKLAEADQAGRHHLQALELRRIPSRTPSEPTLAVIIHRNPGMNHLPEIVTCGPSEYSLPTKVEPPSLRTFMEFAIGAAECCEMLHQGAGTVHGEIRADSFHWNHSTGDVKLISLGSGVRSFENGLTSAGWTMLSREYGVEHKIQFIAPEQTGRLPAAADSRTDLYSLGILFWMMLAGEMPFEGETPLDMMQNVLSRRVPPVSSRRLDVPDALSNVIQKLVQKNIGARYFSAAGLKWDLQEIQRLHEEGDCAALDAFQVGSKDVNSFFTLPNVQVGRDKERDTILKVIDRVSRSQKRSNPFKRRALSPLSSNESFSEGRVDSFENGLHRAESRADSNSTVSSRQSTNSQGAGATTQIGHTPGAASGSLVSSKEESQRTDSMGSLHSLPMHSASKRAFEKRLSSGLLAVDGTSPSLGGSWDSDSLNRNASISSVAEGQVALFRQASRLKKREGRCEIVTVSGAAGMGKSCLVQSVQGPARQRGYFASAKFDQVTRTPFDPVLKVLSSMFRQIFSESDVRTEFHQNLRSFVRPAWPVLSSMLGLPTWLLDSAAQDAPKNRQPSISKARKPSIHLDSPSHCGQAGHTLDDFLRTRASSKSSRFTATFLDVLRYLSTQKLIVFSLDDIQWADDESTELIQAISSAKIPLVLILTRRSREPLPTKMSALLCDPFRVAHVTRIDLTPLNEEDVAQYVASTLHRELQYIFPLVAVIQEKTNGNPFFVRECLDACYRKKCLWYSWKDANWVYDLDKIFQEFAAQNYGTQINNDFIVSRLLDLPTGSRQLIAWASLLGATFSFNLVKTLMMTEGLHEPTQAAEVGGSTAALTRKAGLTRQSSQDAVKALQGAIGAYILMPTEDDDVFRFCHDRYQTAGTHLPEAKEMPYMHFCIANAMLHDQHGYSAYVISSHVCLSIDIIRKRLTIRSGFRDVLFQAGERSTESGGRSSGLTYFASALALLQDNPWDDSLEDVSYSETLVLHHRTAECYYQQAHIDKATKLIQVILMNVKNVVDKVPAWILQSRIAGRRGDHKPAFEILRVCLSHLGLRLGDTTWAECDKKFWEFREEFKTVDKTTLLSRSLGVYRLPKGASSAAKVPTLGTYAGVLSDVSHEDYRLLSAAGAVLCEALGAAFWSNSLLFYQLTLLEIEINLHRGMVSQAGLAYIHLASVAIGRFDLVDFGCEMGELALAFLDQHQSDSYTRGRGHTLYSIMIGGYSGPTRDLLVLLESALELSLSAGDRWSGLLNIGTLAAAKLWCSHDMIEIENFCAYGAEEMSNWEEDIRGGTFITAVSQFSKALQGKTANADPDTVMDSADHTTAKHFAFLEANAIGLDRSRMVYLVYKMWANFLFGHLEAAIATGEALLPALSELWSNRLVVTVPLFLSLAKLAAARENPTAHNIPNILEQAKAHRQRLTTWGSVSDVNLAAWTYLLAAEIAELEHCYDQCLSNYESALDHAEVHGLVLEQALASELYGEFMVRRGSKRGARSAINEAISAYRRISAFGKSVALSAKHEWLLKGTTSLYSTEIGVQTDLPSQAQQSLGQIVADRTSAWVQPDASSPSGDKVKNAADIVEGTGLDMIDLTSILRSSQVLSSELDMEKLFPKLTKIILESTAAELCAIIIEADEGWRPASITNQAGEQYANGQTLESVEDLVGKQITLYAIRFKELVFINNIYDDVRFSNVSDAYMKRNPLGKAVVAMPILRGDSLLGCLYVESQPNSFTERNIHVLQLLVNSIGISIANAMLFKKLERLRANNEVMIESQKHALAQARQAERKAKAAEAEANRNVRLAEEAAKAKSMFLANVSHELRTPLNGVIGMSELLKGTKLSTEQDGFADSIRVCADTLLTVINDILDFSKLEAGKMQLFSVPLSLTETINEVVRALSYSNTGKDLETVVDLHLDEDLLVIGDPVRLHQVFMNLLSNAYKFTPAGKVTVRASHVAETDQELTATFSVEDSGIGISPEQKKKLFQPFSQADSSTARSYGGTGLGLSICRAILENVLKGKIWLESELGKGTKVFFTLKFKKAPKGSIQSTEASLQTRGTDPMAIYSPTGSEAQQQPILSLISLSSVPRSEVRVCIAEDNPVNQRIAVQFVKKIGFKCEAYPDGRQAVDGIVKAKQDGNPFHIVLMDVQMPHLDGYNATRELRHHSDPDVSSVLIIAMTASAIRGDREKCLEAGMNNYLAKPVRQQVLKQMLEGYLNHDASVIPPADRSAQATPIQQVPSPELANKPPADSTTQRVAEDVLDKQSSIPLTTSLPARPAA